jgi:hypothetical protein
VLLHSPGFINPFPDTRRKLTGRMIAGREQFIGIFVNQTVSHRNQSLLEGSLELLQAYCSDLSFRAKWLLALRFKKKPEFCPHNGRVCFELL